MSIADIVSFLNDKDALQSVKEELEISDVYDINTLNVLLVGSCPNDNTVIVFFNGFSRTRLYNILNYKFPETKFILVIYTGKLQISNTFLYYYSCISIDDKYMDTEIAKKINLVKEWLIKNNVEFTTINDEIIAYIPESK